MDITFAPRGILQIDGARLAYRNFSGAASKYNRKGERNFSIIIDDPEQADALINEGWNVKIKPPREDGELPFMHLPVKIRFGDRGPNVYLTSGNNTVQLDEESIDCFDSIDILEANLDIRPYNWEVDGKTGRTAYLDTIHVVQKVDRFAERFARENTPF